MPENLGEKLAPKGVLVAVLVLNSIVVACTWVQAVLAFQSARKSWHHGQHWFLFAVSSVLTVVLVGFACLVLGSALRVSRDGVTHIVLGQVWKQARFDQVQRIKVTTRISSPTVVIDFFTPNASGKETRLRVNGGGLKTTDPLVRQLAIALQQRPWLLQTPEDVNNWNIALSRLR